MIYAELRREGLEADYFTLRYLVYNGDIIGSYGVHFNGDRCYGASRDYHRLATAEQVAAQERFDALPYDEKYEGDNFPPSSGCLNECEYHDGQQSFCDGSSLVERITDNEQRCFEIAAMMAGVNRES